MNNKEPKTCPLCHGSGTKYNFPKGITWSGNPPENWKVPCHGCGGKGWVVV